MELILKKLNKLLIHIFFISKYLISFLVKPDHILIRSKIE